MASKRFLHLFTHLSGRPKRNSLSKRPGLLSAGSTESSRFVAPMTTTSPLESNPSISANRVDTMELWRQKSVFPHNILKSSFQSAKFWNLCCLPVYLILTTGPDWSQTINFIKEDDGWAHLVCLSTIKQIFNKNQFYTPETCCFIMLWLFS